MGSNFFARFERRLGVEGKTARIWFWCGFCLLTLYTVTVLAAQVLVYVGARSLRLLLFCSAIAVFLCFLFVALCGRLRLAPAELAGRREKGSALRFTALVFLVTLAYSLIWQLIFWPGLFSFDSEVQLAQVYSGEYNNWHPFLHTWLFFTIPYKLFHQTGAIVLTQLVLFSLAESYLFRVLYDTGATRRFMLLAWLYINLNPNNTAFMLFPWKDCAMSIFAMVMFTQLIRIYNSEGMWLKNKWHLAAFTVAAFLCNAMRHNAVLLVAPVFLILLIFLKKARRPAAVSAACVLAATLLLQGPVAALAKVEAPGRRTMETMGLPMNILDHVYINAPETMGEEALAFMESLADRSEMEKYYIRGNFNPTKFHVSGLPEKVDAAGTSNILRYTLDTVRRNPVLSLEAVIHLTKQVWRFDGPDNNFINPWVFENTLFPLSDMETLQVEFVLTGEIGSLFVTKYLFYFPGLIILLLLYLAVAKLGGGNLARVFMVLPVMAYNFGTMLLLTGEDYRFFQFNFFLVVPLVYLLLTHHRDKEEEQNESGERLVTPA